MSTREAMECAWPWRTTARPGSPVPTPGGAGRAAIQTLIPLAVGGLLVWRGHPIAGGLIGVIGLLTLLARLCIPRLYRCMDRAGAALGRAVGAALTWLLLAPMFFLVFFPGRIALRMRRRDPLARRFPTPAPSYWTIRDGSRHPEHYRRQF